MHATPVLEKPMHRNENTATARSRSQRVFGTFVAVATTVNLVAAFFVVMVATKPPQGAAVDHGVVGSTLPVGSFRSITHIKWTFGDGTPEDAERWQPEVLKCWDAGVVAQDTAVSEACWSKLPHTKHVTVHNY